MTLAGMTLAELRRRYHEELFDVCLPFWNRYGTDHENGGFWCSLDYDGTRCRADKHPWFQGRGLWVYGFLYNHFGGDPRHLEVARKTAGYLQREGLTTGPPGGEVYALYFAAEGLQEYAWASDDAEARELAFALMRRLWDHIHEPEHWRVRPQGLWMVILRIVTQMLRRWQDPLLAEMADHCVEAIMDRHHNPEIGLNNEVLNFDFSRPAEEVTKCNLGHSIETFWMVMDEADRRGDGPLWDLCSERMLRHLEVAWDPVYGGLSEWINVGHPQFQWPVESPVGTDLEFRFTGEYYHMKALWALEEALVGTLMVVERTGAEWAARYFTMAQRAIDEKFSQRRRGLPGYMLFADREMTPRGHVARQDNYHPPRRLMLCLLILDRMMGREAPA
jgi:mannose/cellobiose epimerase-like protein (N-acyl-D-glucosamine 2-epimerase family)